MTQIEIENRQDILSDVITYDFYSEKRYFSPGEKICINQERGALSDQLLVLKGVLEPDQARSYKIPVLVEQKVKFILTKLEKK